MQNRGSRRIRDHWLPSLAIYIIFGLSGCGKAAPELDEDLLGAIIATEDARGEESFALGPILEGLASANARIQTTAVRALGRLEDPDHLDLISPLLAAADPGVRAEAANALGQAFFSSGGDTAASLLLSHLPDEPDLGVRGVMGRTLGRLRYDDPGLAQAAEGVLLELIDDQGEASPLPGMLGAVMGLDWLARQNRDLTFSDATILRLTALTRYQGEPGMGASEEAAKIRRLALSVLGVAGRVDQEALQAALRDPDPHVRQVAVAAIRRLPSAEEHLPALDAALEDPVPRVRAQAVATLSGVAFGERRCSGLLRAAADSQPRVAVTALDQLGRPCPDVARQIRVLRGMAGGTGASGPGHWHRGAHALLALARISPDGAAPLLPSLATHSNPFARVYAARVASRTGEEGVLEALAGDEDPNVRTAAVEGLFQLRGHDADDLILSQLAQDDPQLLLTASGLLEGTPSSERVVRPLLETLHRISREGKETVRDPRMGIIERLAEVADEASLEELAAYLTDFDPRVANRVAEILTERTGQAREALPSPAPRVPVPSLEELDRLAGSTVVLEIEGGGEIEIRLFPWLAPANAARFARLAESGVFDGLTFHRIASNFVVQGLSPNGNEMAGHGSFTRDELGLQSHWRGTVGTSTRGRDTGDGQIFINLADNLRLDHNYTVFGEVVAGMDVVDRMMEGQMVLRAGVRRR